MTCSELPGSTSSRTSGSRCRSRLAQPGSRHSETVLLAATVTDRATFLDSTRSAVTDTGDYPFLTRIASQFAEHDDREQFQAGVDIILAGIDRG